MLHDSYIGPGSTIGIIGGGQLGKMISIAAANLGYKTHLLTNNPDDPSVYITNSATISHNYQNTESLLEFASNVDIATLEFENIPTTTIDILSQKIKVYPGKEALYISQNRIREKQHIRNLGIKTSDFRVIDNYNSLVKNTIELGYPTLLKTTELGYDGKGQYIIKQQDDLSALSTLNWDQSYILEKFVKIYKEISVIITKSISGSIEFFPTAENCHTDGILTTSSVPALISQEINVQAQKIALQIAESINLVGLLAVEFFITDTQELIVNEIAPRPHNSGHWSLDACNISQFEQLIRAICGLPLKPVKLLFPCIMNNILGDNIHNYYKHETKVNENLYIYGKKKATKNRKMGHINTLKFNQ
ncbi:phosphoribosylaminoimidazole carboxylase, ATPase subunit [Ehrlichia chaffeensis str. Heartland]|uniref:N5-carboxyaminoimidazole ribonucleotide synthase n=2 Tax=Ehrlichia chaffeensis TaxID=945 RepID=Q2GFG3_EHRCR|nr:5-(carboxyamino)imidazole ribonucleotide synthase [Ehrlichia chaffeensis]ABD44619.1 phosphoribosylaminoimidazole carboxylase, ATPase subunit [Ehrlichia chaffeensis str. Arkansas]AHX03308.1 phosphoribosylaminoimidazole carboxylase, ATPase subunit [Ehrlichia chaffeensis str. Heartland]AHX06214.1 phosphoribosylaminoimidazole carboxylase, ATPase subunit [Ehrlichia chaffeensis str. Liberty]AHX08148.1 phosphoribosylaminoimidazole carboxylase, ATPase subunit [Ehrlichia chaffeensis str. Saint Vincen